MTAFTAGDPRLALHRRRKRVNVIALTLSLAAMAFGVFWLIWILIETVRLGYRDQSHWVWYGGQRLVWRPPQGQE